MDNLEILSMEIGCNLSQYDYLVEDFGDIIKTDTINDTINFEDIECVDLAYDPKKKEEILSSTSLLIRDQLVPCPKFVILESEYLANMAEVFEDSEALPVPELVQIENITQIITFYSILKHSDSCDLELYNLDLLLRLDLFVVCDLLGFNKLKLFIGKNVEMSIGSANWKTIYLKCNKIMGLSRVIDRLLDFLLHQIVKQELTGSIEIWTGTVSVDFMLKVVNNNEFDIHEEIKFEFVMDWAAHNQHCEDDIYSLLSLINFKIFQDVKQIQQAETDLCLLRLLSKDNLADIRSNLKEAVEFKQAFKDCSLQFHSNGKMLKLLVEVKNETQWPKVLGCASMMSNDSKYINILSLNDQIINFEVTTMTALIRSLSYSPYLQYRSSIFYIFYPVTNVPQLCQFNLDFKTCFHVLDLPLELKSINDKHRNRRNLVMICSVENYLYLYYLYLFSKDAFSKQNFDSVDKLKVYRIDLDLAIESCNHALACENALLLKWEQFSDIPEEYLDDGDTNFNFDIKAVNVGEDIFLVSDDLCLCLNTGTQTWSEKELAPPARNNPLVFGSDSELFVIGGSCMGQPLVSGQKYNTNTWKMALLPNIPENIFPDHNLKYFKGLYFKNFIYLYHCTASEMTPDMPSEEKPVLILDLYLNLWTSRMLCYHSLFFLDTPVWM